MAKYIVEGLIKEVEHVPTVVTLRFVPDVNFAVQQKDGDEEKRFVVFLPLPSQGTGASAGIVYEYKDVVTIQLQRPAISFCTGKVRLELDDSKKAVAKSRLKGKFSFTSTTTSMFSITKVCEIWS